MSLFKRKPKVAAPEHIEKLEQELIDEVARAVRKHDQLVVALAVMLEQRESAARKPRESNG